ncbi:MAG: HlyD family efflux transporter periplasmic adaptor subunit [Burkholderiaceae bacterium]|nr:HlyD family efflux transporter periplasmic adaptor subunit [Burkholderiaceae bacterium]
MPAQFSQTTRALAADRGRRAHFVWLLCVLALSAWTGWFVFDEVEVVEVSRHARLEAKRAAHAVAVPVAGHVLASKMAIGREVRAGDVLLTLDAQADVLALREARVHLDALPARVDSMRREIALRVLRRARDQRTAMAAAEAARHRVTEADAAAQFAREHHQRLDAESRHGGIARAEASRALADARRLAAGRDALRAEVARLDADARARDIGAAAEIEELHRALAALAAEVETSRASVARLEARVARHQVRAPVDGVLGEVAPLAAGSHVAEGQRIASVVPAGELIIVAEFDPAAVLGRVRPGMAAQMRLDGFPWIQFGSLGARVRAMASEVRDGTVRVELVPEAKTGLAEIAQHGLPGTVEVAVERASPALLVQRATGHLLAAGAGSDTSHRPGSSPAAAGAAR